ncbi:cyclin-D3-2-like [Hordeum vulgare subsp. vulgare]|uniref:Cyclin-like domain-containing protein n=1 Tax=Hordeum vulgare subsp. vulgare TaxID=112509 RepID=A0A8I6XX94_HORVV|nr:cyclin-D3-2-like [Hordeum vulgare subsp. vulgare]
MAFAALFVDSLYCPEEHHDLFQEPAEDQWPEHQPPVALDDELPALFAVFRGKEEVLLREAGDGYGGDARREAAVGWATRAAARLGFSALTAALAAAYLDRCFLSGGALRLGDQPWMARLAAVACVALAAKVEETRVPVLLDLQLCAAESAGDADVFDAKTVRRMELLVLSALAWRMHPVTPFSFLHPVLVDARLRQCESALLAVMPDCSWPRYRPSAWAAAALLTTAGYGSDDAELLALINAPEDEVTECVKILTGGAAAGFTGIGGDNKRKRAAAGLHSPPQSPSGVIGAAAYFSCESSSSSADSRSGAATAWPGSVSVSSSPEPPGRPLKRATATAMLPPDEESRDAWR